MAPYTRFIAVSALLALGIAQSCPAPPSYDPLPEFPPNQCVENYDFELTLGKVTLEKARYECQEECTASESDCSSYLIEVRDVTKCLLFKEGNHAQPTPCHNACKLEGYSKGPNKDILPCLSASPVVATSYCNSLLTATVTSTATITPGASTRLSNFTLTAIRNQTAILTRTVDLTTTLTTTTTLFTSPTVTTNIITIPTATTVAITATATSTSTLTRTVTVTARPLPKRAAVAPPACVPWDTPVSKLSSACVAYNAAPSTVTRTTTLGAAFVTRINNQTITLTNPVTTYETITVTDSITATEPTTIAVPQTASTTTTSIQTAFTTITTTTTVSTTTTTTKTVTPFQPCGLPAGYTPTAVTTGVISCTPVASPSSNVFFRIEAANDTPYEGCLVTTGKQITTPSGGTHRCDAGTGRGTPTTLIDEAARLNGFTYDGSYSPSFNDYFITRISSTQQSGNSYWGVLKNGVFTTTGGCGTNVDNGDSASWYWDVFNKRNVLSVTPQWATVTPGTPVTLTFTARSPNGGQSSPASGVRFAGQVSDGSGQIILIAPQDTGCYRYKGERDGDIRSNYFSLNVFDSFN